jgi:hypothetical protein
MLVVVDNGSRVRSRHVLLPHLLSDDLGLDQFVREVVFVHKEIAIAGSAAVSADEALGESVALCAGWGPATAADERGRRNVSSMHQLCGSGACNRSGAPEIGARAARAFLARAPKDGVRWFTRPGKVVAGQGTAAAALLSLDQELGCPGVGAAGLGFVEVVCAPSCRGFRGDALVKSVARTPAGAVAPAVADVGVIIARLAIRQKPRG